MSKTAKNLIEEEIRKHKSKLRRLDYDRERAIQAIEDLENNLKALE